MPDPKLGKLYDALAQKDPSVVAGLDRENFITKFSGEQNMRKLYEGLKKKGPEFVSGVDADAFVGKFKEVGFWDKIGVGLGTGKVPGKEEEKLAPSMNFAVKTSKRVSRNQFAKAGGPLTEEGELSLPFCAASLAALWRATWARTSSELIKRCLPRILSISSAGYLGVFMGFGWIFRLNG